MNIKKAVHYPIQKKLEKEQNILKNKIGMNKYKMKRLVEEQTLMKRELAELQKLISEVRQ